MLFVESVMSLLLSSSCGAPMRFQSITPADVTCLRREKAPVQVRRFERNE